MTSRRFLRFSATARCECGAGLAYDVDLRDPFGSWECADILRGLAVPKGQEGAKVHSPPFPFSFYEIKSEDQPSAMGATTRPADFPKVSWSRKFWVPEGALLPHGTAYASSREGEMVTMNVNAARQFSTEAECMAWIEANPWPTYIAREHETSGVK